MSEDKERILNDLEDFGEYSIVSYLLNNNTGEMIKIKNPFFGEVTRIKENE